MYNIWKAETVNIRFLKKPTLYFFFFFALIFFGQLYIQMHVVFEW